MPKQTIIKTQKTRKATVGGTTGRGATVGGTTGRGTTGRGTIRTKSRKAMRTKNNKSRKAIHRNKTGRGTTRKKSKKSKKSRKSRKSRKAIHRNKTVGGATVGCVTVECAYSREIFSKINTTLTEIKGTKKWSSKLNDLVTNLKKEINSHIPNHKTNH